MCVLRGMCTRSAIRDFELHICSGNHLEVKQQGTTVVRFLLGRQCKALVLGDIFGKME